ncbi:MAG: cobalamin B12-binding domain-containing protein [Pseudomonadota bacterium]
MDTGHNAPGDKGFFLRLVQRSKRLLKQRPGGADSELAQIPTLIESEIIPRLQMSFQSQQIADDVAPDQAVDAETTDFDVAEFIKLLLSTKPDDARETIEYLRQRGYTLLQIYGQLLTPAARELGEMWEEDLCSFAEVTIALMKIRHIFATTAPLFPVTGATRQGNEPSIILTTVPGEQHTFGMYLAVEHFRAENWHVWSGTPRNTRELINLVASEHCDVVGLSIGSATNLRVVQAAVNDIRANSANPNVKIIAGGRLISEHPEKFDGVDFDLVSGDIDDIESMVAQATAMLTDESEDSS